MKITVVCCMIRKGKVLLIYSAPWSERIVKISIDWLSRSSENLWCMFHFLREGTICLYFGPSSTNSSKYLKPSQDTIDISHLSESRSFYRWQFGLLFFWCETIWVASVASHTTHEYLDLSSAFNAKRFRFSYDRCHNDERVSWQSFADNWKPVLDTSQ